jgi:hypothetical protein
LSKNLISKQLADATALSVLDSSGHDSIGQSEG